MLDTCKKLGLLILILSLLQMVAFMSWKWHFGQTAFKEFQKDIKANGNASTVQDTPLPVAVIVPYRDRESHLRIFINYMQTFLQQQNTSFVIYVVEQHGKENFNRAKLLNVGYREALRHEAHTCFIFHDVDLLPEDPHLDYGCGDQPLHLSASIDIFGYKLPYHSLFGGVSALTSDHMKKVNGFSNTYWGWGGEDDDMFVRIKAAGLNLTRHQMNISRYTMLKKTGKHTQGPKAQDRFKYRNASQLMKTDGLHTLQYKLLQKERRNGYIWLLVDLQSPSSMKLKT